jgi:energy-coupling factor transporter ATP-binding protein EcfA2
MALKQAVKHQKKLRMLVTGPSGSGKTYTALAVATALAKLDGGKEIALYDTEAGSASLYAGRFTFLTDQIEPPFTPEKIIAALREAEMAGVGVVILDSISHAWAGEGGILDIVNTATAASSSKSAFTQGWSKATPVQNKMIEAILRSPCHVICTARSKTEYALTKDEKGRDKPVKLGMAPVQRPDFEYEFDIVLDISVSHVGEVTKSRFEAVADHTVQKPGEDFAKLVWGELQGAPVEQKAERTTTEQVDLLHKLGIAVYGDAWTAGDTQAKLAEWASGGPIKSLHLLKPAEVETAIVGLNRKMAAKAKPHQELVA